MSWAADQEGLFLTMRVPGGAELVQDLQGDAKTLRKCVGNSCMAIPSEDGRHLAIWSTGRR